MTRPAVRDARRRVGNSAGEWHQVADLPDRVLAQQAKRRSPAVVKVGGATSLVTLAAWLPAEGVCRVMVPGDARSRPVRAVDLVAVYVRPLDDCRLGCDNGGAREGGSK